MYLYSTVEPVSTTPSLMAKDHQWNTIQKVLKELWASVSLVIL